MSPIYVDSDKVAVNNKLETTRYSEIVDVLLFRLELVKINCKLLNINNTWWLFVIFVLEEKNEKAYFRF